MLARNHQTYDAYRQSTRDENTPERGPLTAVSRHSNLNYLLSTDGVDSHNHHDFDWKSFWRGFSEEVERQGKAYEIKSLADLIPENTISMAQKCYKLDYSSADALFDSLVKLCGANLGLRPDLSDYDLSTAYGAGICAGALLMFILMAMHRQKSKGKVSGVGSNRYTTYKRGGRTVKVSTGHADASDHNGFSIKKHWPNADINKVERNIVDSVNDYLNRGSTLPTQGGGKHLTTIVEGKDVGFHARWVNDEVRVTTYYLINNW